MHIESTPGRRDAAAPRAFSAIGDPVAIALTLWIALVLIALLWGSRLNQSTAQDLGAPPLFGHFTLRFSLGIAVALSIAGSVVQGARQVAARLRWRWLLASAWATTLAWTLALNTATGLHQLTAPLTSRFDYRAALPTISDPARFLSTFVDRLPSYPVHVQGHPPGMVLVLWALKEAGLGSPVWEAALVVGAGTSAVMAALILCRSLAGEGSARRCAPFLVLAPMAIWVATSADALFLGVTAWSVAIIGLGLGHPGRSGRLQSLAGGLLFGVALMLSYGALALAPVVVAMGCARRALPKLGVVAVASLAALGLFWLAGFSWLDGLEATRRLYAMGIAQDRPYLFFLVADLAAFAIVIGPAGAAGLAVLRSKSLWLVVGTTVLGLLLSDLSGYSKGEVERIWLSSAPWILLATSNLSDSVVPTLLSLQALVGAALAIGVRTPW